MSVTVHSTIDNFEAITYTTGASWDIDGYKNLVVLNEKSEVIAMHARNTWAAATNQS